VGGHYPEKPPDGGGPVYPPFPVFQPTLQQGFIELGCQITNHTATQSLFGPFPLGGLGLAKQGRLKTMATSFHSQALLSYGGTFVQVYFYKAGTSANHLQLINDYIFSGSNPAWFGDIEIWPDDEMFVYVSDNQGTSDFLLSLRGEYVFA
jgi:hypothetical protein